MQKANRRTVKAGQEIDHAACRQMDRKVRRCSMHQADRWTEKAGQEIDHAAGQQTDIKGRAGD
jgi:hypothetical protein